MKLNPELVVPDTCQTSIDILRERCLSVLPSLGISSPSFADHQSFPSDLRCGVSESDSDIQDVVLFGSFLTRFLESGYWPDRKYRLWTLSSAARNVLTKLCGLPSEAVGIIPRYALFPRAPNQVPVPDITSEPCTLVFGGRISAVKNLCFLLRTVSALQTGFKCPVSLALFGNADNDYHSDRGRRTIPDYEASLHKLAAELPWNEKPVFNGKLGSEEWLENVSGRRPVFVSLSSFYMEDFNVALAQAESCGWPAIVSAWGGHLDAAGENLAKIDIHSIAHSHEPPQVQELKSWTLATHLVKRFSTRRAEMKEPHRHAHQIDSMPSFLTIERIDMFRRAFLEKFSPDAHLLYRDSPERFADTEKGRRFFAGYRSLFAAGSVESAAVVLINDLHHAKTPELNRVPELCRRMTELMNSSHEEIRFVAIDTLTEPLSKSALLHAKQLIIPFLEPSVLSFLASWLRLDPEASVRILCTQQQDQKHVVQARELLRPQDRIIVYDATAPLDAAVLAAFS